VTGPQLDNRRVAAALIDIALLIPVALVMSALFGGFTGPAAALTLGWALYYYFAFESDHGQTLGKRVMKIRVVRADGGPLDAGRVAVRTLLRPIDGIGGYLVGLVVMLATGQRRQRLGDLAAGTVVTDAHAPAAQEPTQSVPTLEVAGPQAPAAAPEPVAMPEPETMLPPLPSARLSDLAPPPDPVPEVRPFEPFAEPKPEPPPADQIVPVDHPAEAKPSEPTDEPVPVPQAEEPEAPEQPEPQPPRLGIVSSPIDLVMQEDEEEAEEKPAEDPPADQA
jgi:uncharacterized RDD family membrane protein YckC